MKSLSCSPIPLNVGNNIRKLRLSRGFKQTRLAKILEMSPVALSNIENGKADISLTRLCAIAEALNVEITILFSEQTI